MWTATASGELINLNYALRVYMDTRGRLLAQFLSGDVEIAVPGSGVDIPALLATLRACLPGFQAVM
jgi:hypothetical protein